MAGAQNQDPRAVLRPEKAACLPPGRTDKQGREEQCTRPKCEGAQTRRGTVPLWAMGSQGGSVQRDESRLCSVWHTLPSQAQQPCPRVQGTSHSKAGTCCCSPCQSSRRPGGWSYRYYGLTPEETTMESIHRSVSPSRRWLAESGRKPSQWTDSRILPRPLWL